MDVLRLLTISISSTIAQIKATWSELDVGQLERESARAAHSIQSGNVKDVMKRRTREVISEFTSEPDAFLSTLERCRGVMTGLAAVDIVMGKLYAHEVLHLVFRQGVAGLFVKYLQDEHSYRGGEVEERLPTDIGNIWRLSFSSPGRQAQEILVWESDLPNPIANPNVISAADTSVLASIQSSATWSPLCVFVAPCAYGLRHWELFTKREVRMLSHVDKDEVRQGELDLLEGLEGRGFTWSGEAMPMGRSRDFCRASRVSGSLHLQPHRS